MIPETVPASSLTTSTGHHDTSAEPWHQLVDRCGVARSLLAIADQLGVTKP
jgi:hypothetical protein